MSFHVPEKYRVRVGPMASDETYGNNGMFVINKSNFKGATMTLIASDGEGWEHVSVSFPNRAPTWLEMCRIKKMFWDEEDCVVQFHPPRSQYVDRHPFCLHLWRPIGVEMPRPPKILVG